MTTPNPLVTLERTLIQLAFAPFRLVSPQFVPPTGLLELLLGPGTGAPPDGAGEGVAIEDTFVAPDGTPLNAHTATGPAGGFPWTHVVGAMEIVGGQVAPVGTSYTTSRAQKTLGSPNMYVQMQVTRLGTGSGRAYVGVSARYNPTGQDYYYWVYQNLNGVLGYNLRKVTAGAHVELLAIQAEAISTPLVLEMEALDEGTGAVRLNGYINGQLKQTFLDTNNPHRYTYAGVEMRSASAAPAQGAGFQAGAA